MKNTIYFDEAGNTGQDLLNQQQKIFVLASVRFNNEQVNELSKIFNNVTEIHFKKLKNSSSGRNQIIEFLNHKLICEQNIIVSVCHKKFATIAHIVDRLIEPVFYDKGIDLYFEGKNLIYANFLFYLGETIWEKSEFNNLLEAFIKMMRTKDEISITNFYLITNSFSQQIDERLKTIFITPIIKSRQQIKSILESVDKFSLDVTLSSFFTLCDLWYKKLNTKINIVFDNSKQIGFYQEVIKSMKQMNIEIQEVGYGNRTMIFPTQIDNVILKDSSTDLSLQFSDLIASTIAFMYNNQNEKHKLFIENIQKSKLLQLSNYHTIWPYPNFSSEDIGMKNSRGNNILDFLVDYNKD